MNIISLFQSPVSHLSNFLENNLFLHELEHNIFNSTNELNLDLEYKNSKKRKDKYYVQQTRVRTLITSIAVSYLRNKMIDEFKLPVNIQIEKYTKKRKI